MRAAGWRHGRFLLVTTALFVGGAVTGDPSAAAESAEGQLRVGAAVTDVTPPNFPVLVNGGFTSKTASEVNTPVNARAIVIDDGGERIAIVVVDSCMMPRPLLDDAKRLAAKRTEIAADRMLISATHTHSAPSCMGALGTDADPAYVSYLREKLAEAIVAAEQNLTPAEVGFGSAPAAEFTALRRWVRRSDRVADDPFGNPTVRANMHAARNWDDVTGPSGPEDPELSMIAFRGTDGRPLAVLANFSMHYFGDRAISADYFGLFSDGFAARVEPDPADDRPPFVGVLSHGCSGDIWRRDYTIPADEQPNPTIDEYTEGLLQIALAAYERIEYRGDVDLAMAERRMRLGYRVPDRQRLEWAERIVEAMGDRLPQDQTEVLAREQVILHERQDTEIVVQALRIGDIAIATTPNETYALSGLKLKARSPAASTMVIELANGGDGYIPPPEQHLLGGYNTWAARSAGLEVEAEPKIVEAATQLLEQVTGEPRRPHRGATGPAAKRILQAEPFAYWRLDEMSGPIAVDRTGHGRNATYEPGVVFYLEGPQTASSGDGESFHADESSGGDESSGNHESFGGDEVNRAAHFAGGRLRAEFPRRGRAPETGDAYSVSLWFWNGMPNDGRETAGWFFSRDHSHGITPRGDHLGIGGTATEPGRLLFLHGDQDPAVGKTEIERWTWNRVTLVRESDRVRVYLNDRESPEIELEGVAAPPDAASYFFGGRSDNRFNFEGRLDEIALFDRAIEATR